MVGDHMQFVYGALSMVAFLFCLVMAFMAGRRSNIPKEKAQAPDADQEEQKRKVKAMQNHFSSLMNYDVDKALGKKVT